MDPAKLAERNDRQYRWIERLQARVAKLEALMQRAGLPIPEDGTLEGFESPVVATAPAEQNTPDVKPKLSRAEYQRELMRKRRAALKAAKDQS